MIYDSLIALTTQFRLNLFKNIWIEEMESRADYENFQLMSRWFVSMSRMKIYQMTFIKLVDRWHIVVKTQMENSSSVRHSWFSTTLKTHTFFLLKRTQHRILGISWKLRNLNSSLRLLVRSRKDLENADFIFNP